MNLQYIQNCLVKRYVLCSVLGIKKSKKQLFFDRNVNRSFLDWKKKDLVCLDFKKNPVVLDCNKNPISFGWEIIHYGKMIQCCFEQRIQLYSFIEKLGHASCFEKLDMRHIFVPCSLTQGWLVWGFKFWVMPGISLIHSIYVLDIYVIWIYNKRIIKEIRYQKL